MNFAIYGETKWLNFFLSFSFGMDYLSEVPLANQIVDFLLPEFLSYFDHLVYNRFIIFSY